jgi:hypothetical protein
MNVLQRRVVSPKPPIPRTILFSSPKELKPPILSPHLRELKRQLEGTTIPLRDCGWSHSPWIARRRRGGLQEDLFKVWQIPTGLIRKGLEGCRMGTGGQTSNAKQLESIEGGEVLEEAWEGTWEKLRRHVWGWLERNQTWLRNVLLGPPRTCWRGEVIN